MKSSKSMNDSRAPFAVWEPDRKYFVYLLLLLAGLTVLLYLPALKCDFIQYDDPHYVTRNPNVLRGITQPGLEWAFLKSHAANWHPLTWVSHMLDCELYGLNPPGHHLTNILLHAANAALALWVFYRMTGSFWRSLAVAAFFAWHPLRVESVAWVSERKDVLSGLFFFLTLLAYESYVRHRSAIQNPLNNRRYLLTLLAFACGLMSKPMLVTLPFLLLLLDYWPLKRLDPAHLWQPRSWYPLLFEKIPFLLLTVASCLITYAAQNTNGATRMFTNLEFWPRLQNVGISYCRYIGKTLWPENLSLFYPFPPDWWPPHWVFLAFLALAGTSLFCLWKARRHPHLLVGWFWYLGTLVPVIGLVQVGQQSIADRYTYLTTIGLSIGLLWAIPPRLTAGRNLLFVLAGAGILMAAGCAAMTRHQLGFWKNGVTLFARAKQVTPPFYSTAFNLGLALRLEQRHREAIQEFDEALAQQPNNGPTLCNKAKSMDALGYDVEAEKLFLEAIRCDPGYQPTYPELAQFYLRKKNLTEAEYYFVKHLEMEPEDHASRLQLGCLYLSTNRHQEAERNFLFITQSDPYNAEARFFLSSALRSLGRPAEALQEIKQALVLRREWALAHNECGILLMESGSQREAIEHFRKARDLEPANREYGHNFTEAEKLLRNQPARE